MKLADFAVSGGQLHKPGKKVKKQIKKGKNKKRERKL